MSEHFIAIRFPWSSITVAGLNPTKGPHGSSGFMLAFDSREAAEAFRATSDYPTADILTYDTEKPEASR